MKDGYVCPFRPTAIPKYRACPRRVSLRTSPHRLLRRWRRAENPRTRRLYDRTKKRLAHDEVGEGL